MIHTTHHYDDLSGWCLGCGARRQDGRTIGGISGHVFIRGPEYTPEQLADHAHRVKTSKPTPKPETLI